MEIEELLPHRGAALFLSAAEVDGLRASGEAVWNSGHPHILGHFPDLPVVPGIFLIEAAAQLAGVALAVQRQAAPGERRLGVLAGVRRALFHRPVLPGQTIRFEVLLAAPVGALIRASALGRDAQGRKAATVELAIGSAERALLSAG
ncbi:MAG: hypothetical protein HKL90_03425 [Elusimicrobia bacterium]|nr:hypothetical protein [Elusimicrobiota bacterium]